MRRFISILCLFFITSFSVFGQCTPNFIFTSLGIPGVYPPNIPIPNIPLTGITDGMVGSNYNETLTLIVLEDTSLDITTLVPALSPILSAAGINPVMSLNVNHVIFDVQGLPNGLNYTCDQSNCQYLSGVDGCIHLNGIPTQSGTFPVDVNMTINVQIPSITDPIFGTTLYAGGPIDIPSFTAIQYDLYIEGANLLSEYNREEIVIFPNPSNFKTVINLKDLSDIRIRDSLGRIVFEVEKANNRFTLFTDEIGAGIFFVEITNPEKQNVIKLIVN